MGIWRKKSTHPLGKKLVPTSQALPIRRILQYFSMLWEIGGKTHAFHILWSIPWDWNLMDKSITHDEFCWIFPGTNFPGFSHSIGFPAFSHALENWWQNPCISNTIKYTTGWESNGKKDPFYGKSNFPGFPYSIGFTVFSNAMGNWWRNLCVSHLLRYTIGWESYGEK